eukprot:Colp12_sorted_trinity150504_noHs@16585
MLRRLLPAANVLTAVRQSAVRTERAAVPAFLAGRRFFSQEPQHDAVVVSVVGADRVGIVRDFTRTVHAKGANIEDGRSMILGGEFCMIMLLTAQKGSLSTLEEAIKTTLPDMNVHARITREATPFNAETKTFHISIEGPDSEGIVSSVSEKLAAMNINVSEMSTSVVSAPFSGDPLFQMEVIANFPPELVKPLRASLKPVLEDFELMCDIDLQEDYKEDDEDN